MASFELDRPLAAIISALSAAASHAPAAAQTGLKALAFDYAATAVGQPFEVARILLQIQWTPRASVPGLLATEGTPISQDQVYQLILPSPVPDQALPVQYEGIESRNSAPLEEDFDLPLQLSKRQKPVTSESRPNDPEAKLETTDAGAMLASVWSDTQNEDVTHFAVSPQRNFSPSPELWPEAEADWMSNVSPPRAEGTGISPASPSHSLISDDEDHLGPIPHESQHSNSRGKAQNQMQEHRPAEPDCSSDTKEQHSGTFRDKTPNLNSTPKHDVAACSFEKGSSSAWGSEHTIYTPDTLETVLPTIYSGGFWDMVRAVCKGPEGWRALFKGTSTTFLLELMDIAPTVQCLLARLAGLPSIACGVGLAIRGGGGVAAAGAALALSPKPWHAWSCAVLSHVMVQMTLAPLDTLRTRTVAQLTLKDQRKYPAHLGALTGLRTMAAEEGGWIQLWFSRYTFWPALLSCTVRFSTFLAIPILVDKILPYDGAQPATTARVLLSLALQASALLITLPMETVRRRMQVQPRYDRKHHAGTIFVACQRAHTSPATPYALGPEARERPSAFPVIVPDLVSASAGTPVTSGMGYLIRMKGLRTCVQTRPIPYTGFMETIFKICGEETSTPPWTQTTHPHTIMPTSGVFSFYRGFSIALMTLAAEAALALLWGESNAQRGAWAEL